MMTREMGDYHYHHMPVHQDEHSADELHGMHRDVFIEPLDELHEHAFFNEHHYDPHGHGMPVEPVHVPYAIDHEGHVEVLGMEDHHEYDHHDLEHAGTVYPHHEFVHDPHQHDKMEAAMEHI